MSFDRGDSPNFSQFLARKPRQMKLSRESLVKTGFLDSAKEFPMLIEPNMDGVNLVMWARANRAMLEAELLNHGAILLRGFKVDSVSHFEQFTRTISPELLDYNERAAPRTEITSNIYTSTEYPADEYIPLHHEMSYSHNWPVKIWFFCAQPAEQGGRTPIADDRKIFHLIDPKIKEQFLKKRVMYVRNYNEGVDLPWQEVFQTGDRSIVEQYCRRWDIQCEWIDGVGLRTRQVRQAVATHPRTGDTVWFNHAHMFHVSNLRQSVRDSLLSEFKDDELPRNAFYGDGSRIESSVLEEIRELYRASAVSFPWQKGDILMVDNFLASHGREAFVGPRKILVAMAELFTNTDI